MDYFKGITDNVILLSQGSERGKDRVIDTFYEDNFFKRINLYGLTSFLIDNYDTLLLLLLLKELLIL
jgi:hypothetical protein